MYKVAVRKSFTARHALIGADFGAENTPHAHAYVMEVCCEGERLDAHGFLVDIDRIKQEMTGVLEGYAGRMLNEQPELAGKNPTVENFSYVVAHRVAGALPAGTVSALTVTMWEDEDSWASYTLRT